VARINQARLAECTTEHRTYRSTDEGPNWKMLNDDDAPKHLELAKGCPVIITKNHPNDSDLPNGRQCIVREFGPDYVEVTLNTGGNDVVTRRIYPMAFQVVDPLYRVQCKRTQIPLRPAYAITIHKSQGMTLQKVDMDLASVFAPGQAYVALSRGCSLDSIRVKGLSRRNIIVDPSVVAFENGIPSVQEYRAQCRKRKAQSAPSPPNTGRTKTTQSN